MEDILCGAQSANGAPRSSTEAKVAVRQSLQAAEPRHSRSRYRKLHCIRFRLSPTLVIPLSDLRKFRKPVAD